LNAIIDDEKLLKSNLLYDPPSIASRSPINLGTSCRLDIQKDDVLGSM